MAKYGKKAQSKVKRAMHERKRGTLKSGRSGKTVKSKEQAIAIGLSEARKAGGKVPAKKSSRKKSASRKKSSSSRTSTARKSTARKSTARKSTSRKKSSSSRSKSKSTKSRSTKQ